MTNLYSVRRTLRFSDGHQFLYEIAALIDGHAAISGRTGQLEELEAIANQLRDYADSTTPGGYRLCSCGGSRWAPPKGNDGDD